MTGRAARPRDRDLPATIPIFPLTGALLLPRGRLPLNIFEPRYLAMIDDALGGDRMIGMIQPSVHEAREHDPPVFRTGCAGRIVAFAEEGERYVITLLGVSRFDVAAEVPGHGGYRQVAPDWGPYLADRREAADVGLDRPRLIAGLHGFFKRHGLSADWKAVESAPEERLVTLLSMTCPFAPIEKQALLQARDLHERSKLLIGLVETDALAQAGDAVRH